MRVVHLGKYYPPSPGGIETVTRTLAQAQAAAGADVRVVVVNHAAPGGRDATFERWTRTPDAEEMDGPVRVIRVGRRANVAKLDVCPGLVRTLRRLLRAPPDVWHLQTPNVTMMLALAAVPGVRPLVIQHHSDIVRQRVLQARRPAVGGARLPTGDPRAVGQPDVRRRVAAAAAVRGQGTAVLPLGIDLDAVRRALRGGRGVRGAAAAGARRRRCG